MSGEHTCPMACSASSYNRGCRLRPCRDAHRAAKDRARAKLQAKPFDQIPHGTANAYANYACRCDDCKLAGSIRNREYREKAKARKARGA